MKFKTEKIYSNSPIWLQNLLVSLYGAKIYYERYAGIHEKYLQYLLSSQWFSADKIEEIQQYLLQDMILYAYNNVSYYRKQFDACGIPPYKIQTIQDLNALPILSKETIRTRPHELTSVHLIAKRRITCATSGTTGKSLKVLVDINSRRKSYAFMSRLHRWAGIRNDLHSAAFTVRLIVPKSQEKNVFWRFNAIRNCYHFSSYHLSEKNIPYYLKKMQEINPKFIEGYPSGIYVLARYMLENSTFGVYPQAIFTTAETLQDYQRSAIEKAFQCKVFDQYGCAEHAVFISQCEKGNYHVHPEYGIVEIINKQGEEVNPGELGKVICTSFTNKAMPLIRYDIGDMAIKGEDGSCGCGRSFPLIDHIEGRKDDVIRTPDGREVARIASIFRGLESIKLAQIVQRHLDMIEVFVVPGESYTSEDGALIKDELHKRLGDSITIEIKRVEDIPREYSGKFKTVISMINH